MIPPPRLWSTKRGIRPLVCAMRTASRVNSSVCIAAISMPSTERFVERLWRAIKIAEAYLPA